MKLLIPILTMVILSLGFAAPGSAQSCPHTVLPRLDSVQLGPEHVTGGEYRVVLDPLANDRSATGEPLTIVQVEAGNPATGQLTLNPEGTVTFRGQPGNVGSRIFFYQVSGETGSPVDGAIAVHEGDVTTCVATAQLDGFTVPVGDSSHPLDVLANDSTPGGCARPHLIPFATPTGEIVTARNGRAKVDPDFQVIRYSPPSLFYSGAADSFSYSIQGPAGSPVTTSVTVAFSGYATPAVACSTVLARTGPWVVLDSHCSQPSTLQCDGVEAYLSHYCWSFGDGGSLPSCDPLPNEIIYIEPGGTLCIDANQDGYHDPSGLRCRARYSAVSHTYSQPVEYSALLRVTDNCGRQDTGGTAVDLRNRPPVAALGFDPAQCWGLACPFSATGSRDDYGIETYRWDFGHSGPPASGVQVEHVFPALGTYRVALVIEDVHGLTAREERDVTLTDRPPIGIFEWSCQDLTCTLTDHSLDDFPPLSEVRWRWKNRALGTSGVVGLGSPVAFTAPVPGIYELTLLVTDSSGQPDPTPPVQIVDIFGNLVAEPDWAALPAGQTQVDLPVLGNDRSPAGGLQIVAVKPPQFGTASVVGNAIRYVASSSGSSLSDAFGYEVVDAAGHRAAGQIRVVRQPIAQVGRLAGLSTTRQRVNFATPFPEPPLVFALPVSRVYPDAVSARIVGVDAAGFTIFLQEPEGTSDGGAHAGETVSWLAILPTAQSSGNSLVGGTATLDGATIYAASRIATASHAGSAGGTPTWAHLRFPRPIVGPDVVVLAQTQTENDPSWVTVRVDEIAIEGFRLALQPREASLAAHGMETVAWLAIPAGLFQAGGGTHFEAGLTSAVQTEALRTLEFAQVFARPPLVVAGLASARDEDPAVLRYRETFAGAIELAVHEESSHEADLTHAAERVAYVAFEEPALFAGSRDALLVGSGDLAVIDDVAYYQPGAGPFEVCPVANDEATAGPLEIAWFSKPPYGSVRFTTSGLLRFWPDSTHCEDLEIPYGVTDGAGRRAYGTVRFRCGLPPPGSNDPFPVNPNACGQGGEGGGVEQ